MVTAPCVSYAAGIERGERGGRSSAVKANSLRRRGEPDTLEDQFLICGKGGPHRRYVGEPWGHHKGERCAGTAILDNADVRLRPGIEIGR